MRTTRVELPPPRGAPDGACPTLLLAPDGGATRPAVVLLADIFGVRPAIVALAEELARDGHVVAVPDWLHRTDAGAPLRPDELARAEARAAWIQRVKPDVRTEDVLHDVEASLVHLAGERSGPAAVVGYCLGGRLALVAAGRLGDRVGAAAAYHPANLVSDAPDSPHGLAATTRARVYVGAADDDPSCPPAQLAALGEAYARAGVPHTVEVYAGARHGFVPADVPAHDAAATARHWSTLRSLLATLA